MRYTLGRGLQLVGLVMLPLAMAGELAGKHDLIRMLSLLMLGIAIFYAGYLLQGASK